MECVTKAVGRRCSCGFEKYGIGTSPEDNAAATLAVGLVKAFGKSTAVMWCGNEPYCLVSQSAFYVSLVVIMCIRGGVLLGRLCGGSCADSCSDHARFEMVYAFAAFGCVSCDDEGLCGFTLNCPSKRLWVVFVETKRSCGCEACFFFCLHKLTK